MKKAQEKTKFDVFDEKEKKLRETTAKYLQGKISLEEYCRLLPSMTTKLDFRKLASELEKQRVRRQLQAILDKGEKMIAWFTKKFKK